MKITAIVPAAGTGSRYSKTKNKLLENLNGTPVIVKTLQELSKIESINEIIVCTSVDLLGEIKNLVDCYELSKVKKVILGGSTRQESVFNGLKQTSADYVLIHDGARPIISVDIIENSIKMAIKKGASIVAVPAKDTIKRVDKDTNQVLETLNRSELWNVQTPQVFKYSNLLEGHEKYKKDSFTDDSAIIEKLGHPVYVVKGSYKNIKITTEEDLHIAEIFLNS